MVDITKNTSKTKYRQDGYLQQPKDLQYRYEDVILDLDGYEVANDDGCFNSFGFGKRKVIDEPHEYELIDIELFRARLLGARND